MSEAALGEASKGLFVVSIRTTEACKNKDKKRNSFREGRLNGVCWMGEPEVLLIDPAARTVVYFRAKTRQAPRCSADAIQCREHGVVGKGSGQPIAHGCKVKRGFTMDRTR